MTWAASAQPLEEVADARILSRSRRSLRRLSRRRAAPRWILRRPLQARQPFAPLAVDACGSAGAHRSPDRLSVEKPQSAGDVASRPSSSGSMPRRRWKGRCVSSSARRGRTCAWFDYGLSFTGWRGAWVAFDRDMQGTPEEGMDEVVVTVEGAPGRSSTSTTGSSPSFQDVRHHTADFQAPFINAETMSHWLVLLQSWRNPMPAAPARARRGCGARYGDRREAPARTAPDGEETPPIETLRKRFASYGITENRDGTLHGKPIWFCALCRNLYQPQAPLGGEAPSPRTGSCCGV